VHSRTCASWILFSTTTRRVVSSSPRGPAVVPAHNTGLAHTCLIRYTRAPAHPLTLTQVHHVLAEIIQGGLVLETNINEISACGESASAHHLPDRESKERDEMFYFESAPSPSLQYHKSTANEPKPR
jgi:hypothetical protein